VAAEERAQPGFSLCPSVRIAKGPRRLSVLIKRIAIVREEKKQPGEMIPIAINKLAGLAVDKGKSVYGVASSAPGAYPLRASNAALSLSTMTWISHCLKVKHSSLSTSATICCNLFVVETRLFGFKACACPFVRLA
jgi:hypothetical protein